MADQPDKHAIPPDADSTSDDKLLTPPPTGDRQPSTGEAARPPDTLPGWHEPPVEEGSSRPVIAETWFPPEGTVEAPASEAAGQAEPGGEQVGEEIGAIPLQTGAWYTPPDAQLNALLSGAAETIIEVTEPEPEVEPEAEPAGEATQVQAAADTQEQPAPAEGWEAPLSAAELEDLYAGVGELPEDQPPEAEAAEAVQAPAEAIEAEAAPESELDEVETVIQEPAVPAESTPSLEATPAQPVRGLSPAEAAFLAEKRAAEAQAAAGGEAAEQPVEPAQTEPSAAEELAALDAAADKAPAPAPRQPSQFEQVERKVDILRQRYNGGYLTREELQNELRNLMILDDSGRWWMLGLETNQWYYYDGSDWVSALPPGYEDRIQGSAVPTETGMQEVVDSASGMVAGEDQADQRFDIEIDEDGMPLPKRVPQDDPGATLVSPSTPFMEPMRRSEAPTQQRTQPVGGEAEPVGIAHPAGDQGLTQPARPGMDADQATVRSEASAGQTLRSEAARPQREGEGIPVAPGTAGKRVETPAYAIGKYPQPDYSLALGGSRNRNTYIKWGVRLGVVGVIGGMVIMLLALVGMIVYYFNVVGKYKDAVANLGERASTFETTQIFNAGGNLLAEFNDPNTGARKSVPLDQISPWLIHATVATENETFYTDPGFSVMAILRATYQNLQTGSTVSGASTITQQLARALVLETELAYQRTTERKIIEVIVASEIKRQHTKNEILEIYLNEIFYGNFAYGIEAAAQTYFNKPAADLNPAEAAFLAGLPQAPATYDPIVNREAAINRMNDVLRLMSEANGTGCIAIEHDDLTGWAVPNGGELCITAQEMPSGDVVYYYQTPSMEAPEEMTLEIALVQTAAFKPPSFEATHPHFVNYVWQQLEDTYGSQAIYSAGYRVYTTLDENIQTSAEQAVTDQLASLQTRGIDATNASVIVMRPADGAVIAMVGSADFYNEDIDGQVNVAFTGQQPGSSIKPFVYLAAFEPDDQGRYITPATVIWDVYSDFNGYIPTNYDRLYHGPQTVRESLGNSLNVPAVKALNFVGMERFTEMAKRIGLRFPLGDPLERQAGLPTALGAVEVRLFDMTAGFAMLANNGRRVDPYAIVYIQDKEGNEIYRADTSPEGLQVVKPEYAYLVTSILADNEARATEFGRGWPMELQGGRIAAIKTGTTTDSRDVWSIGYTPQYVVGVWVGNSDNRPMYGLSGYAGAAPIWNTIMETAHAGLGIEQFSPPAGLIQAEVCNDSGSQPSSACAGRTHWEIFAAAAPPPGADQDIFRTMEVDSYTGKLVNDYCRDEAETRTFLAIDDPTAYNWLNNTPEGNAWAEARGLEVPVMPPPTEYCDPNEARPTVIVSTPAENMTVEGVVPIMGALTMPDFNRYELRYGVSHAPEAFSQPFAVETTQWPEANSLLGQLDTRALGLENGPYTLRLVVIDNYGRSVTRDVHVNISNPEPTPVPTALPTPTLAPTPTSSGPEPLPTLPTQESDGGIPTPTLAPTLTPTWTLTPTPE
ncbi:MAG: transglycosylase domain-containing protein [Anaerolineae bacterium]|nr:transglycosylase domain-containing protein [Anaerolineae bacterium]